MPFVVRRLPFFVFVSLALSAFLVGAASARNGHWQPNDIKPTSASLDPVLALYARARGGAETADVQRIEHYTVSAGGESVTSELFVRGADFRVTTTIDGGAFESGRTAGVRWRRTPNGLTRTISADIQGDDLDRWPLATLAFDPGDCTLSGEASVPAPAWVVEYHPENDVTHWWYIDKQSGDLVREVWREGSVVVSLDFDDFRTVDGKRRPYHWIAGGSGAKAEVRLVSLESAPVSQSDVTRPPSLVTMFDGQPRGEMELPAGFEHGSPFAIVTGTLEGNSTTFILDSGTSQVLVDGALAHDYGIHTFLGHGIARELSLGKLHLRDVAIQTTGLPRGVYAAQAIVGYELFSNRVVHIDYRNGRAGISDSVPDSVFVSAWRLETNCESGMPLVRATVDNVSGRNFALDTGSSNVVLLRYLWEHDGVDLHSLPAPSGHAHRVSYLEGELLAQRTYGDVLLGPVRVTGGQVDIERTNLGDTIEAPLDGIIGMNVLGPFEWWFDCAHHSIWFRKN